MKSNDRNFDFVDVLMDKAFNFDAPLMPNFVDVAPKEMNAKNMISAAINDDDLEFLNAAGTTRKQGETEDDIFE